MFKRNDDQYVNGNFTWFIGSVEDINDTENLNRVKVRAYGYYDDAEIKTDNLPWATVMMPVTSASTKGVGGNHHLEVGSWVVGFFRDGPSAQDPMVIGSIATQTDGTPDIPEESYVDAGAAGNIAKAVSKAAGNVVPSVDNKSYKSKAGHLIEVDNTDGKEQIRVTHKSGSFIKFLEDGTIQIDSGGAIDITSSDIITLKSAKKTRVI